ncbi:sugar phosphate isomerase/epimerase family protein [Sphingomonas sp.]|uniref:sugar phosphate isomerase/epimerase family protein n=1 Tax=Sphingomonas sp. TaxID=28214 RepID=UPI002DD65116|nr:TIM barrel protein [Sphingomonas sp.]
MKVARRAVCALPLLLLPAARRPPRLRPAIQLFAVRRELAADAAGTLRRLARLGYRSVETVGTFGHRPAAFRQLLDDAGLKSPAQHIMPEKLGAMFARAATLPDGALRRAWLEAFGPDGIDASIREAIAQARELGQRHVVWQMLWPEQIDDDSAIARTCGLLNRAGTLCAEAGFSFALHNQAAELAGPAGATAWDRIMAATDARLVRTEIDFAAAYRAGRNPVAMMREMPGRAALAHVRGTPVDDGGAMLHDMLHAARAGDVEHAFIDYERLDDPMKIVARDAAVYRRAI